MVINSNIDVPHNDIYHLNLIIWCPQMEKSAIVNYCAPLAPTAEALFTPNTVLLHSLWLIQLLNKTENHKDICLKIYASIWAILICYLILQHLKKY